MTFNVKIEFGPSFSGGAPLKYAIEAFERDVKRAETQGAQVATQAARMALGANRRPDAAPRPGRSHPGPLQAAIRFYVDGADVALDVASMDHTNPYWIVQEIGTNASATLRTGGSANPVGRPAKGADYVEKIPSQVGRVIRGLAWADSGGSYAPPSKGVTGQQLEILSNVRGVPGNVRGMRISKEITGRHFIQRGSKEGFRVYQTSVLAAARSAFGSHPYKP